MKKILNVLSLVILLYLFLMSVRLLGDGFKMFGGGFAERLISTTSNPFIGLFIGILATSLVQSSSTTTCTVVGFVASGLLSVQNAVPIIMGANIGTTVTSTFVSLGHITRREEFRRAMAAATVHDFFNILAVAVLFPLEMATGILRHLAQSFSDILVGKEGLTFASPIKKIVGPAVEKIVSLANHVAPQQVAYIVAVFAMVLLMLSLFFIVKRTKKLALNRAEVILDRLIGKSGFAGIAVGCCITAIIQSSSVTTSLMVPLAGAGIVRLDQILPITLGANIGTTVTALLASLAGDVAGLTIAIAHLLFNIFGILLIYPIQQIRNIPMALARWLADAAARSKQYAAFFIIGVFYALPLLLILLSRLF